MDLEQLRKDGMTLAQLAHNHALETGSRDDALIAATLEAFMAGLLAALAELQARLPPPSA